MEITHKELIKKLSEVEFFIGNKEWYPNKDYILTIKGTVCSQSQTRTPYINKGASFGGIVGEGKDLDELAQNIFSQIKNNVVLLGRPLNFIKKLEFIDGKFVSKELTQEESIKYNSDY